MTGLIDPVGAGLIVSQARPGGNTTSISSRAQDMSAKWLELLCTVIPTAKRIVSLCNPANRKSKRYSVFTTLQPLPGTNP